MKHASSHGFLAKILPAAAAGALALAALALAGCDTSFYGLLGNKVSVIHLAIGPVSATIPVNGSLSFTASGGAPPYTFSMVSGFGTINASSGAYTASATAGTETVQVRDKQGTTTQASITVTSTAGPLAITPSIVSINVGGSMRFIATGGTPPYTFSIQTAGSAPPAPSIVSTTGAYVAGSTVGTDTIQVTDSSAGPPATCNVSVTSAITSVNYDIPAETLPTSGIGGTALAAGYSFTVKNVGTANGAQAVNWWVFLSPNPAPGSGTILLESGSTAQLAAGASASIPLSWTWPAVPPVLPGQTRYLYIMISAADDITTSDNTFTGPSLVVAPPDIDYTVSSVSASGGTQSGTAINGSFTLVNSGAANGAQNVSWTAYISPNSGATIDAGAQVIDSGTTGALAASASNPVTFGGTWPAGASTYYLKVAVSSADEVDTTDDVQASAGYLTTNVDNTVTLVTNTGGLVAGAGLAGNFTVQNSGTANGSQTITWQVYASTSPALGGGSTLVASGTTTPFNVGQSGPVNFTGTWPAVAGSYYLIAKISSTDDPNTANNQLASTVLAVNPASVDYAITSVAYTSGSTNPAGALNGTLQFTNNGPNAGTQFVTWQVYASKVNVLDGTAVQVASGSYAPLAASTSSSLIGFSGTWPLVYGNYYLIAKVTVPVDVDTNTANNVGASLATTAVGFYVPTLQNNNPNLSNPNVLPITLQPGMSISISASMNGTDLHDIYQFNTGTAASVTFAWSWGPNGTTNLNVMNSTPSIIDTAGVVAGKSVSLLWTVDLASTNRWIDLDNAGATSLGGYTLIITGN